MVFISGPRQAGKTTLAEIISETYTNSLYFNWDIPDHRIELLNNLYFFERVKRKDTSVPLIIFDEIHKYRDWKNYLKGIFDKFKGRYNFLITGSGRLDLYQKGGDSLAGRYLLYHLWPFTLAELGKKNISIESFLNNPLQTVSGITNNLWEQLNTTSGFPEPFLKGKRTSYNRWSNTYSRQIIREDIRDLSGIKNVVGLETLYYLLPEKVGSPVSIPSISDTLKVSYNTVHSWLLLLERFFLTFSITPWSKGIKRAINKERKVYLWDTPRIKNNGARFENSVALELYRAVTIWNDLGYGRFSLHYIRDKEKNEIDFIITNENRPFLLIETKLASRDISKIFYKIQNNLNIPGIQLIHSGDSFELRNNKKQNILIAPASMWLPLLP